MTYVLYFHMIAQMIIFWGAWIGKDQGKYFFPILQIFSATAYMVASMEVIGFGVGRQEYNFMLLAVFTMNTQVLCTYKDFKRTKEEIEKRKIESDIEFTRNNPI